MGINGTYKISIEMSARKQVNGLLATAKQLVGHVGAQNIPDPPDKEQHIQKVIAMFKENQEAIDSIAVTIEDASVTIRSSEGEMVYEVKSRQEKDAEHVDLVLENDDMGQETWKTTLCGNFLMMESENELSEYVLEKA